MENELLLKSIENLLDKKLEPINKRLDNIEKRLDNLEKSQQEIKETQKTILKFVTEADSRFKRLEETTKDVEKLKKLINISNVQ